MKAKILDLVKQLNHRAKILESKYGKVDVKELVNTGLFKLEVAQSGYGWLQDLHAMTVREVCLQPHSGFSPHFFWLTQVTCHSGQWQECGDA